MSYPEKGPENENSNNEVKEPEGKKHKGAVDLLLGLGVPVIFYGVAINVLNARAISAVGKEIIIFIMLGLFVFACVKSMRKGYRTGGIMMIVFCAPLVLFLMLAGACALMLGGGPL